MNELLKSDNFLSLSKEIASYISSETPSMYCDMEGKKVPKMKFIRSLVDNQMLKKHNLLLEYADIESDASSLNTFFSHLQQEVSHEYGRHKQEYVASKFQGTELPEMSLNPYKYLPFIDAMTGKKVMVNKEVAKVSKLDFDVWYRLLSADEKSEINKTMRVGLITFDPYQADAFETTLFEKQEVIKLNLYEPPTWMQDEDGRLQLLEQEEIDTLECPDEIMNFLNHLFPHQECLEFVLNWMHYALTRRCETYLTLNGKKGAGKGIFCNQIMQALVGEDNFLIAPESILDSIFNSALENNRLLVLDEVRVDNDKQLNKLKKYANNKQNIEKKGIDANNVVETFSSNIISNNDIMDMRLTWDERRFSIPELTDESLLDVWDQQRIESFVKSFETDIEMVKQFGYWVFYKCKSKKYHEFSAWKSDRFYTIVYHSLAEWKKVIVDAVLADKKVDAISISDCKKEYRNRVDGGRFPVKPRRIKEFLDDFRYNGVDKLGELEFNKDEEEWEILKSDKFISKKVVSNKESETYDSESFGLL